MGDVKIRTLTMKVREVIKLLTDDGWFLHRTKGSHRHFRHPTKSGKVTVPGKMGKDIHPHTSIPSPKKVE